MKTISKYIDEQYSRCFDSATHTRARVYPSGVTAVSRMLYEVYGLDTGNHLANAVTNAGLDLVELEQIANAAS